LRKSYGGNDLSSGDLNSGADDWWVLADAKGAWLRAGSTAREDFLFSRGMFLNMEKRRGGERRERDGVYGVQIMFDKFQHIPVEVQDVS